MNSPLGSRFRMPVSRPCRTRFRSLLLQTYTGSLRDHEHDRWHHEQRDLGHSRDRVDLHMEGVGDDVVSAVDETQQVERQRHRAEAGADRSVTRAVEQVVLPLVAGHPGLDERVDRHRAHHQAGQDEPGHEDVPADGVAPQVRLPVGHRPQGAFQEADIPVRLGTGADLVRIVGTVEPHRVDLGYATQQGADAEDDEEEAAGLGHVHRHEREADDVLVGLARAGELGVLLDDDEHEVHDDQRQHDAGDQQDVCREHTWDHSCAGELSLEEEELHVRPYNGYGEQHAFCDPQAGTREQVVRDRVATEALDQGQCQQAVADHPVELTRLAERAGEEDAQQVHHDGDDEDQRRPVVDLTHQ